MSLYWSLTTLSTVGYGDVTPSTDEEKVLSMIVMIFGSVLYATIIGNVANCMLIIASLPKHFPIPETRFAPSRVH